MQRFATPHRRNIALAAATGLGTNTIRRYYEGGDLRMSHFELIERACSELNIEPRPAQKPAKAVRRG